MDYGVFAKWHIKFDYKSCGPFPIIPVAASIKRTKAAPAERRFDINR